MTALSVLADRGSAKGLIGRIEELYDLAESGITINDDADNRVLTATGSSDTIQAEQNLVFASNVLTITGGLNVSTVADAGADVDKFLVLDGSNNVDYRTGAELLSDIGAAASSHYHDGDTLQLDGINSDGGAFNFVTTGTLSFYISASLAAYINSDSLLHCSHGLEVYKGNAGSGYSIHVPGTDAATAPIVVIENSNNSVATAHATHQIECTTGGGDPRQSWKIDMGGVGDIYFTQGIDNSSSDIFGLWNSNSIGTNPVYTVADSTQIVTFAQTIVVPGISGFITNDVNNYVLTATGADQANGEANLQFDGTQLTCAADLLLSGGTQNYLFTDRSTALSIQSQTSGSNMTIDCFTKDGDGTDRALFQIFNVGIPSDLTDAEYMIIGVGAGNSNYEIRSTKIDSGNYLPIKIWVESNANQMIVNTDGTVSFSGAITPHTANGSALGSASLEWSDLYLADGGVIYGQNDQSNTITSGATGWTFNTLVTVSSGITGYVDNNTNNYLLTSTGGNTINGEANFTFDGSAGKVTGSFEVAHASSDPILTIDYENTDNAGDPQLVLSENGVAQWAFGMDTGASNACILTPNATVGGNTDFYYTTDGRFGIGANPTIAGNDLHLAIQDSVAGLVGFVVNNTNNASNAAYARFDLAVGDWAFEPYFTFFITSDVYASGQRVQVTANYCDYVRWRTAQTNSYFRFDNNAGTEIIRFDGSGNIQMRSDSQFYYSGAGNDGYYGYNGTDLVLKPDVVGTGAVRITTDQNQALIIGNGVAGKNYYITFDGPTNDGFLQWVDASDYFRFYDDVLTDLGEKHYFGDTAVGVYSQADTFLDLVADGAVRVGNGFDGAADGSLISGAHTPGSANTYALGSTSAEWSDIYLGDGAVIYGGNDQDTTLTHQADSGWLLNSTRKLYFNDTTTSIGYVTPNGFGGLTLIDSGNIHLSCNQITIGDNSSDTVATIWDGTTANGTFSWIGNSGWFRFDDEVLMLTSSKFLLRDSAIGIYSQADTFLDLVADGAVRVGNGFDGAIDGTLKTGLLFIQSIKSGATQAAAGAAANEVWKTASHASLPDNVLMIGV